LGYYQGEEHMQRSSKWESNLAQVVSCYLTRIKP
jgi:hypothetical protein